MQQPPKRMDVMVKTPSKRHNQFPVVAVWPVAVCVVVCGPVAVWWVCGGGCVVGGCARPVAVWPLAVWWWLCDCVTVWWLCGGVAVWLCGLWLYGGGCVTV